LREEHGFNGYIHLKTIPDADPEIVSQAGLWADRVSINIELPTTSALSRLAPDKSEARITGAMGEMKSAIVEAKDAAKRFKSAPRFAPAGQSTQMIVGADAATDTQIIDRAASLYQGFGMRRVYYSAFSPIPDASAVLPLKRPPLMREHRLYQSDWLLRFYGYDPHDIRDASDNGMLPLDIDPKLAWAIKFRNAFPVDVNQAERERLLRVPGLGVKAVKTILSARRYRRLRLDDIARLTQSIAKVRPFIVAADWRPTLLTDSADLRRALAPRAEQLELFAA
jgi:predicted DNA-binding helix-hairpin-helix protein